jgi:hypothetical protein
MCCVDPLRSPLTAAFYAIRSEGLLTALTAVLYVLEVSNMRYTAGLRRALERYCLYAATHSQAQLDQPGLCSVAAESLR